MLGTRSSPADDLADSHQGVVDDHGKLIGRAQPVPADDEVSSRAGGIKLDAAQEQVVPGDCDPAGTRNRQANGRSDQGRPSAARRWAHVPGYIGPSSSACGALAARSISARVQVQG